MFATLTIDEDKMLCQYGYKKAAVIFKGSFDHPKLGLCAHLRILNEKKFTFACLTIGIVPIIEESCHWKYDYSD